jgi:hypothetical protein
MVSPKQYFHKLLNKLPIHSAGKYGFLDEAGLLKVVEYSSNNVTGFTTNLKSSEVGPKKSLEYLT